MGLSVSEFLDLDTIELNAMIEEYNNKILEQMQVDRLLATHIVNSSGMLKKAAKPEDLFYLPTDKKKGFTTEELKKLTYGEQGT